MLRQWPRAYQCGPCAVVMGDLSGAVQEAGAPLSSPGPVVLVPFATNDCLFPVCPWCVLRATHGDVDSAGRKAAQAMSCGPGHQGQGHCDYIVMHALKWCQELCRSQSPHAATSSSGNVQWRALTMGRQSMQLNAAPCPSPWQSLRHGASEASASSTQNMPPPPRRPRTPPPWFAGERAAAKSVWGPYAQPPPPPHPATSDASLTFQVWGGKKTRWISYEPGIQLELQQLWASGGGSTEVVVEGMRYRIDLTAADNMWQNRLDTEAPARKVRILNWSDY